MALSNCRICSPILTGAAHQDRPHMSQQDKKKVWLHGICSKTTTELNQPEINNRKTETPKCVDTKSNTSK